MSTKKSQIQAKYDSKNCKLYSMKLNKQTDKDIITKLSAVPSMQGYIKQLIRKDIKKEGEKTMKRISIDNGIHWTDPETVIEYLNNPECVITWDTIVNYMDDEAREAANTENIETKLDFLKRYLELAPNDLVIG